MGIPFVRDIEFEYGAVAELTPLVRRVVARNPSAFTFHGTGTYILGRGKVAVVDPGPLDDAHVAALCRAIEGETVTHILVTHTHLDHSPAAEPFKRITGAPTYGFGPHGGKRGAPAVEEGGDWDFAPDHTLSHGDVIEGGAGGWTVEAVHTPGHTSNHLCFALREESALFSGDHVMGWSTSVISPPDGDMGDYLASLRLLLGREDAVYWPTHGPPITAPRPHVEAFLEHRQDRERQILAALAAGRATIPEMVAVMYADVDPGLHRAAGRSVLSHLVHMTGDGRVVCEGAPGADSRYAVGPRADG